MTLPLFESYREIPLTRGLVALVDPADYDRLSFYRWCAQFNPKTRSYYATAKRDGSRILMHRVVLDAPPGMIPDHVNHNTLDNRRQNLRLATAAQNCQNRRVDRRSKSGYKGVHWYAQREKWGAIITSGGKRMFLGLHMTPEDAARAYDAAAREHFGEFAHTNFSH